MKAIDLFEKREFLKEDGSHFDSRKIDKSLDEDFFDHIDIDNVDDLKFKELSNDMYVIKLYSYMDIDTELGIFVYCFNGKPYCIGTRVDPDDEMTFIWKETNDYFEIKENINKYLRPLNPRLNLVKQNDLLPPFFQVPYTNSITKDMMNRAHYNGQLCEIVDLLNDETTVTIRQFGNIENIDITDLYFAYL